MKEKTDRTENSSGSFELPQDEPVRQNPSKTPNIDSGVSNFFSQKHPIKINNPPTESETVVIKVTCCSLF